MVDLFYIAQVTHAKTIIFDQWFLFFFLLFASLRSVKIVQRSMKSQRTFLDSVATLVRYIIVFAYTGK